MRDHLYRYSTWLAALVALTVMMLMICGPGACPHPIWYVLGWLVYIPTATWALMPLIARIGQHIDEAIRQEQTRE